MALRFGLFGRKDERDPEMAARLKTLVREALALNEETGITISEISCADPACPVLETIVLVMPPGQKTRAYKMHGSMAELSADEVRAALNGDAASLPRKG